jgi:hypothetical protein
LKGTAPSTARILLRQPGGDAGGASAVARGAEFSEGEEALVFLGTQNPDDRSYDVFAGRRGKFVLHRDESGRAVLDVRLGADASAYGRAEKAPGTGLSRIPVELFEQLAAGAKFESVADFQQAQLQPPQLNRGPKRHEQVAPAASSPQHTGRANLHAMLVLVVLAALFGAVWLMRRGAR